MIFSMSLIKTLLNIDDSNDNILKNIEKKLFNVTNIITRQIPETVVIWKCIFADSIQNSKKLKLCKIDCWKLWIFQVITWWENIKPWIYVPYALSWTYLPFISIKIEKKTMVWIESDWMICSKEELWINEDKEKHNIWDLNEDFNDLTDDDLWVWFWYKYLRLNNVIFETPNFNNDFLLNSHFWIWLKLNWIYRLIDKKKNKFSALNNILDIFSNSKMLDILDLSNKSNYSISSNSQDLNSYVLIELENIQIKKNDFYLRNFLNDCWINSRNVRIDMSNLFMILTWQPIHFFDRSKIKWWINIRNSKNNEIFKDLFWKEHILNEQDLVICDDEKIVALAWIIWWENSWIDEDTKSILVEIWNFDSNSIKNTRYRLNIESNAWKYYEKWVSKYYSVYVVLVFLDFTEKYRSTLWEFKIKWLNYYFKDNFFKDWNTFLNIDIELQQLKEIINQEKFFENDLDEKIWDYFNSNWISCELKNKILTLKYPLWKINNELIDNDFILSEFLNDLWFEFLNKTSWDLILKNKFIYKNSDFNYQDYYDFIKQLKLFFVNKFNFIELINDNLLSNADIIFFNINKDSLFNQYILNEDFYFVDSLRYKLINYFIENYKFDNDLKIFEIWDVWIKWFINLEDWSSFKKMLWFLTVWKKNESVQNNIFLNLKSIVWFIWNEFFKSKIINFDMNNFENLLNWKSWDIFVNNYLVWFFWLIHPKYYSKLDNFENIVVGYCEFDLNLIFQICCAEMFHKNIETKSSKIDYKDISFLIDFQSNYWDIYSKIENLIWKENIQLNDLYCSEKIWNNKKSISIRLKFSNTKDEKLIFDKIIEIIQSNWWEFR